MYKRILIATDGSDTSDLALKTAIRLAKDQEVRVRILHVADLSPATFASTDMPGATSELFDKIVEGIQSSGEAIIERSLKQAQTQLSVIALKNATPAFDETLPLSKYAPTHPDLLEIADECCRLVREVRGVAHGLEQIVNALIDKAVALESILQREKWEKK